MSRAHRQPSQSQSHEPGRVPVGRYGAFSSPAGFGYPWWGGYTGGVSTLSYSSPGFGYPGAAYGASYGGYGFPGRQ
jgi:hypothetical protein